MKKEIKDGTFAFGLRCKWWVLYEMLSSVDVYVLVIPGGRGVTSFFFFF